MKALHSESASTLSSKLICVCNSFLIQVNLVDCCGLNFLIAGGDIVEKQLLIILCVDRIEVDSFIGWH